MSVTSSPPALICREAAWIPEERESHKGHRRKAFKQPAQPTYPTHQEHNAVWATRTHSPVNPKMSSNTALSTPEVAIDFVDKRPIAFVPSTIIIYVFWGDHEAVLWNVMGLLIVTREGHWGKLTLAYWTKSLDAASVLASDFRFHHREHMCMQISG